METEIIVFISYTQW